MSRTSVVMAYLKTIAATVNNHIDQLIIKESKTCKNLVIPFREIYNKINITLAITDCLTGYPFRSESTETNTTKAKKIVEAEKKVYRDFLFVATMSTIEYHFSQILLQYPNYGTTKEIQKKGVRKVKFGELIEWASNEKILLDYDLWDFVISARNDIVHHNAIARNTKPCPIHDFPIDMNQGDELSGKLRSLLSLTRHIEESFFNIVLGLQE